MKKPDGKFHEGKVHWTPDCPICGEKMKLKYHKCYGCGLYIAREFKCPELHATLSLTDTCPNCGYIH